MGSIVIWLACATVTAPLQLLPVKVTVRVAFEAMASW